MTYEPYERAPGLAQPARQQPPPPVPATGQKKKSSPVRGCLFLILVVFIAYVVIDHLVTSGGPSAAYQAVVTSYTPEDPASLVVTATVTNTGRAAGAPQCTIQASDQSDAYTGTDVITMASIPAGQSSPLGDTLVITHQGAAFITQVTVTCQ